MGKRGEFVGLEEHGGRVRIVFQYRGERCRETLSLEWSVRNCRAAAKMREEILGQIRRGTFDYAAHFPESPNVARFGGVVKKPTTFGELADEWLKGHDHVAPSTLNGYRKIVNRWRPLLGDKDLRDITGGGLKALVAGEVWKTPKTRNNAISILRMVFDQAVEDGYLPANPADAVKFAKVQREEPDPFSLEEVEIILGYMAKNLPAATLNHFEFAFFTGLRPSEAIALDWPNVDFRRGTARIDKAKTVGQVRKVTKTGTAREVELNSRALAALKRQKELTFLAGAEVFLDPLTGKPYVGDQPMARVWRRVLKACGLRHRAAYQTRHTSVTLNLMAGANPYWVAKQHGHSVKMTLEVYSKWIPDADKGRELGKLDGILKGTRG